MLQATFLPLSIAKRTPNSSLSDIQTSGSLTDITIELILIYLYISFFKCSSQHFFPMVMFETEDRIINKLHSSMLAMLAAPHAQEVAVGATVAGPYL